MVFSRRIVSFGIIGATSTVAYAVICMALIRFGTAPVVASLLAYAICCPWSYWANAHYTFDSRAAHLVAAPRFLGTAIVSASVAAAMPLLITDWLRFPSAISVAVTCIAIPAANYILAEFFIFQPKVQA